MCRFANLYAATSVIIQLDMPRGDRRSRTGYLKGACRTPCELALRGPLLVCTAAVPSTRYARSDSQCRLCRRRKARATVKVKRLLHVMFVIFKNEFIIFKSFTLHSNIIDFF